MAQRCQQVQDDANNQVRECRRHIESQQGQYVLDLQMTGRQRDDFRRKCEEVESDAARVRNELQQAERDRDTAANSAKTSSQEAHQALAELRRVQGDGEAYQAKINALNVEVNRHMAGANSAKQQAHIEHDNSLRS